MPARKINTQNKTAEYHLLDYLAGRDNKYPYHTLPIELEEMRQDGYTVTVISVPGFIMLMGFPEQLEYPYIHSPYSYKTAADGISGKNGKQFVD